MKSTFLYLIGGFLLFVLVGAIHAQQGIDPTIPDELQTISVENANQLISIWSASKDTKQISVSPDSHMIAVAIQHGDSDYSISIFNIQTKAIIGQMQGRMDSFADLVWSPDSKRLAVISGRLTGGGAGGVEVRSVKTYQIEKGADPGYYSSGRSDTWYSEDVFTSSDLQINPIQVSWNSNSSMIAIAFYEKLDIYDVAADKQLFSQSLAGINKVEWSTDGKMITTQTIDNLMTIWGIPS